MTALLVLDTNVFSEVMRQTPDAAVLRFVRRHEEQCRMTAITRAELQFGVERLPFGARRESLRLLVAEVVAAFESSLLPFDAQAADHYAAQTARNERSGAPKPMADIMIAAICQANTATLATRNVADFTSTGLTVVNPWTG